MTVERTLCALLLIAAAGGCSSTGGTTDPGVDALPTITYEPFVSKTWSLTTTANATQLAITDGGGAAACALSTDYRQTLGTAGVEIIVELPGTVGSPCPTSPASGFDLTKHCTATFGSGPYVPAGCAYYRRWDAQGTQVGQTIAIDGVITIVGDAASCTMRVSITFLGNSFVENFTLMNGASMQPWCRES